MAAGKRRGLFSFLGRDQAGRERGARSGFELVVLKGPDAGTHFRLDRPEMRLGRGEPANRTPEEILLSDRSVSSQHAILRVDGARVTIEHRPSATNPTLVNRRPISKRALEPGDEIVIGRVHLELRAVATTAKRSATVHPSSGETGTVVASAAPAPGAPREAPVRQIGDDGSEARGASGTTPSSVDLSGASGGRVVVVGGAPELEGTRFELQRPKTTIGRSDKCDITLPNSAISRRHASIVWEGARAVLIQESMVNPTRVNGLDIEERRTLTYGDEILLAEQVKLYVILDEVTDSASSGADTLSRSTTGEPPRERTIGHRTEPQLPISEQAASGVDDPERASAADLTVVRPKTVEYPAVDADADATILSTPAASTEAPTEPAAEPPTRMLEPPADTAAPARPPTPTVEPTESGPVDAPPVTAKPAPEPSADSPTADAAPPPRTTRPRPPHTTSEYGTPQPHRIRMTAPAPIAFTGTIHIAIIGSGPAGLAAAAQAAKLGIQHTLLERAQLANTVQSYHKGKWVMSEPQRLPLRDELSVGFEAGTREAVLDEWQASVEREGINLKVGAAYELVGLRGEKGSFELELKDGSTLQATHVVLAIGLQGNPRAFDAPGADQDWIDYQLADPAAHAEKKVVIFGVGDAGLENAFALVNVDCEVSVVNRRSDIDRAKPRNLAQIQKLISDGTVTHYMNATVARFEDHVVILDTNDGEVRLEADLVIGRLGATPPRRFLEALGVAFPSDDPAAVPEVTAQYETNLAGVYLIGALAGYPLIKNCMNQGYEVIEHIQGHEVVPADEGVLKQKFEGAEGSVREILDRIRDTISIFSGLTAIQLRDFLFESEIRRLAPGEIVYERNDFSDSFFAILSGVVRATLPASEQDSNVDRDADEREHLEHFLEAGSFFGEDSLISGRRRGATLEVFEAAVLIETPRMTMTRLLKSVEDVRRVIDESFVIARLQELIPEVPPDERARLAATSTLRTFKPNETIFEEGDEPDGLHLIRRGTVTASQLEDGLDSIIQYYQAGAVLGELALLEPGRTRSTTLRSTVFTETIFFAQDDVVPFMQKHEPLLELFLQNERDYAMADVARKAERNQRNTMIFVLKQGGHEATDLLLIDESLCIRCDNCEKACAGTHGGVSRLDREAGETHATSSGAHIHVPTACQHCENPHCMDDCPPDALRRDPDGEVFVMDNCIGCGNCEVNCPYDVIQMAAVDDDPGPGLLVRLLFGRTARKRKPAGDDGTPTKKAVKCDLCRNLPAKRDGSATAACVASCPTGAIVRVNPRDFLDELINRV